VSYADSEREEEEEEDTVGSVQIRAREKYLDVQLVLAGWTAKLLRVNTRESSGKRSAVTTNVEAGRLLAVAL
jgi:hypothetical protein